MTQQAGLFQQRITRHQVARGKGRTQRVEGVAEDGMEYALKRQLEGASIPATEFICQRLAAACALATPLVATLTDLDGATVLGSRIEGGLVDTEVLEPAARMAEFQACAGRMSACFALDLLVGNVDRHFGNFLYRRRADGTLTILAIDYDQALWRSGWPPVLGAQATMTLNQLGLLRAMGLWRSVEALTTLSTASSIRVTELTDWMGAMPAQWLTPDQRQQLLDWWGSEPFHQHVSRCTEYCR